MTEPNAADESAMKAVLLLAQTPNRAAIAPPDDPIEAICANVRDLALAKVEAIAAGVDAPPNAAYAELAEVHAKGSEMPFEAVRARGEISAARETAAYLEAERGANIAALTFAAATWRISEEEIPASPAILIEQRFHLVELSPGDALHVGLTRLGILYAVADRNAMERAAAAPEGALELAAESAYMRAVCFEGAKWESIIAMRLCNLYPERYDPELR